MTDRKFDIHVGFDDKEPPTPKLGPDVGREACLERRVERLEKLVNALVKRAVLKSRRECEDDARLSDPSSVDSGDFRRDYMMGWTT